MKTLLTLSCALLLGLAPLARANPLEDSIHQLQTRWAEIKYRMTDEEKQEAAMETLTTQAAQVSASYPGRAEPLIWQAIITSSQAGIKGGLGALGLVKDAKKLLEQAEAIDANALNGSVYTSLGSLYYKVPGWPVGFGDDDKARAYLQKALAINPTGIDPNFFYGEFLYEQEEYAAAIQALERALRAPARPGRELADAGRKQEIQGLLASARKKMSR